MAKRVFIVHGWGGSIQEPMHSWMVKELRKRKIEAVAIEMPNSNKPEIIPWVEHLNRIVGLVNKKTYFIGHSIGCQAILRYLQTLEDEDKVGGCILIAGWFSLVNLKNDEEVEIAKPWVEGDIKFDKIKKIVNKIIVYLSNDDPYNCVDENAKIFREMLGAEVIVEINKGHFTEGDGVTEMPEVLDKILEISK
ncbi:MAG: alpha/beta hydrolase [Nanoarchaeota archaeon]